MVAAVDDCISARWDDHLAVAFGYEPVRPLKPRPSYGRHVGSLAFSGHLPCGGVWGIVSSHDEQTSHMYRGIGRGLWHLCGFGRLAFFQSPAPYSAIVSGLAAEFLDQCRPSRSDQLCAPRKLGRALGGRYRRPGRRSVLHLFSVAIRLAPLVAMGCGHSRSACELRVAG